MADKPVLFGRFGARHLPCERHSKHQRATARASARTKKRRANARNSN